MAALPGAWRYRVSAGTGLPGVSTPRLVETASLICNFYLSVAALQLSQQIRPLRYISMLLGLQLLVSCATPGCTACLGRGSTFVNPIVASLGVYGVSEEKQYLRKPDSSIPWDGREHRSSPSTHLSLLAPRKLLGITVATPRQTASAGGLNEVRGRCTLNYRWADRAPSALAGSRSRGGSPDQRPQPKSEMQNHLVPKRCITHFTFASCATPHRIN